MSALVGDVRPSSWPAPNYVDPNTNTTLIVGMLIPCGLLVLLFVGGRLFAKANTRGSISLDDWLMTASAAMIIGVDVLGCIHTLYGAGYHIWDIPLRWAQPWGKISLASYVLFVPSVSLTKISLCVSYLRLFPSRLNKWFCYVTITFLMLWSFAVVFLFCFACSPIAGFWDPSIPNSDCLNIEGAFIVSAAINSLTDFTVFLWPTRMLWSVQLPLQTRLSLVFVFGVGCIVCTAGILRAWYITIYFDSADPFYKSAVLWAILGVEGNFGVICGCLPPLKPALRRLFPGAAFGRSTEILNMYANDKRCRNEAYAFRTVAECQRKEGLVMMEEEGDVGGEGEGEGEGSSLGEGGSEEWLDGGEGMSSGRLREEVCGSGEWIAAGTCWWDGGAGGGGERIGECGDGV